MPTINSAKKRMKTSEKKRVLNRKVKSNIRITRNKLYTAIADGDETKLKEIFRKYCSLLDKAVKKGVIKANTASRRKSRVTARLRRESSAGS